MKERIDLRNHYKVCNYCGQMFHSSHFRRYSRSSDGLYYWCKECERIYKRLWYVKNRRKAYVMHRNWVDRNRLEMNMLLRDYRVRKYLKELGMLPSISLKTLSVTMTVEQFQKICKDISVNWRDQLHDVDVSKNE